MSVLLVSSADLPAYASGRDLRLTATWDGLRSLGAAVTVLRLETPPPPDAAAFAAMGAAPAGWPTPGGPAGLALRRALDEARPSLLVLTDLLYLPLLPADLTARVLLDLHNVESDLARQIALAGGRWAPGRRRRLLAKAEALARLEAIAMARADGVTVCSEEDRRRLLERFGEALAGKLWVLPNVLAREVAPAAPRPIAPPPIVPPVRLLFTGLFSYPPNAAAAAFLLRRLLPLLRRQGLGATLTLAGRKPPRWLRWQARLRRDVTVTGAVPSTDPFFQAADVMVVPLFQGGGTRLKIIEAALFGLPVVATGLAAEGLGFVAGREFLRAETAEDFAAAIARLCREPALARDLAAAARAHALRDFSLAANRRRWQALIPAEWLGA